MHKRNPDIGLTPTQVTENLFESLTRQPDKGFPRTAQGTFEPQFNGKETYTLKLFLDRRDDGAIASRWELSSLPGMNPFIVNQLTEAYPPKLYLGMSVVNAAERSEAVAAYLKMLIEMVKKG